MDKILFVEEIQIVDFTDAKLNTGALQDLNQLICTILTYMISVCYTVPHDYVWIRSMDRAILGFLQLPLGHRNFPWSCIVLVFNELPRNNNGFPERAPKVLSLRVGFEPTREYPIGFQVQRLNHSAIAAH